MSLTNTRERYGRVAQFFHWTTAAFILLLLASGIFMVWLPIGSEAQVALKVWFYSAHKTVGVVLLLLAVARILWAFINPKPEPLYPERKAETFAAETVHWLLYAGIILAPLTGLAHHFSTTGFAPIWWPFAQTVSLIPVDAYVATIFKYLHFAAAVMIVVSLVAHIGGALKHAVVDKDQTVTRMVCGPDEHIATPGLAHRFSFSSVAAASLAVFVALSAGYGYATQTVAPPQQIALSTDIDTEQTVAAISSVPVWTVDTENSTLGITVTQLGSPVEGAFANWQADIRFDPDALEQSSVTAQIDVASLELGSVSAQATSNDFLSATDFPIARFEAIGFAQLDDGSYVASGQLTIKEVTQPFDLPFNLAFEGDRVLMQSSTELNRMDFGVGAEGYANEDAVGFAVQINIEISATRAQADAVDTGT